MDTVSARSTHTKPVLHLVLVENHGTLDCHGLTRQPVAQLLQIATPRVLVRRLDNDPPRKEDLRKAEGVLTRTCDFLHRGLEVLFSPSYLSRLIFK